MAKKGSGLFQKGNALAGSREGIKNKYSLNAVIQLADKGYNPLEKIIWVSDTAIVALAEDLELVNAGRRSPMESQATKLLRLILDANKELASYTYQKPKNEDDAAGTLTFLGAPSVQQIEKAQQALEVMKINAKSDGGGSGVG